MQVRCLDLRAKDVAWKCRAHAAGNKVTSLDCHPMDANLLLSAGNDHFAKLFDIRALRDADVSAKCVSRLHVSLWPTCSVRPWTFRAIILCRHARRVFPGA